MKPILFLVLFAFLAGVACAASNPNPAIVYPKPSKPNPAIVFPKRVKNQWQLPPKKVAKNKAG